MGTFDYTSITNGSVRPVPPLGLVHGRWLDDVTLTRSKKNPRTSLVRISFQPDDEYEEFAFPVIVLRQNPDDYESSIAAWHYYKAHCLAVGIPLPDTGYILTTTEDMVRGHLAGREVWLDITEKRTRSGMPGSSKDGLPFISIEPIHASKVFLALDGHWVRRQR